jgi:hypothetical protein
VPALHERYPLISFFSGDGRGTGAAREFCAVPTREALVQMLHAAGFPRVTVKRRPSLRPLKKLQAALTGRPQTGRLIVHAS